MALRLVDYSSSEEEGEFSTPPHPELQPERAATTIEVVAVIASPSPFAATVSTASTSAEVTVHSAVSSAPLASDVTEAAAAVSISASASASTDNKLYFLVAFAGFELCCDDVQPEDNTIPIMNRFYDYEEVEEDVGEGGVPVGDQITMSPVSNFLGSGGTITALQEEDIAMVTGGRDASIAGILDEQGGVPLDPQALAGGLVANSSPIHPLKRVRGYFDTRGYLFRKDNDGRYHIVGRLFPNNGQISPLPFAQPHPRHEPMGGLSSTVFWVDAISEIFDEFNNKIGLLFDSGRVILDNATQPQAEGTATPIIATDIDAAPSALKEKRRTMKLKRQSQLDTAAQIESAGSQANTEAATQVVDQTIFQDRPQPTSGRFINTQAPADDAHASAVLSLDEYPNPPGFIPVNFIRPGTVREPPHVLYRGTGVHTSFSDGSVVINGVTYRPEGSSNAVQDPAQQAPAPQAPTQLAANAFANGAGPSNLPFGGNPYWPFDAPHQSSTSDAPPFPVYGANQITRTGPVTLAERIAFLNSTPPMRFATLDHPANFTNSRNPYESYDASYQRNLDEMSSDMLGCEYKCQTGKGAWPMGPGRGNGRGRGL